MGISRLSVTTSKLKYKSTRFRVIINRILKRGVDSGRADDQDTFKIKKRFDEYNQKTSILKKFYKDQNKFFSINGQDSINQVKDRLTKLIDKHKND